MPPRTGAHADGRAANGRGKVPAQPEGTAASTMGSTPTARRVPADSTRATRPPHPPFEVGLTLVNCACVVRYRKVKWLVQAVFCDES